MDFDIADLLDVVQRSVSCPERAGQTARAVTLARSYPTTIDDLWDAVTNGERIRRWFLPITGKLERGGRYQLEGNAGGVIVSCEPPSILEITWEFGQDTSRVDLLLSEDGTDSTHLALTHTALVSEHWEEYGPGGGRRWLGIRHHWIVDASHTTYRAETR